MKVKNEKTGKIEDLRLPKRFKAKWIKALRSGEYKQGSNLLQDKNKYCCLGVACRVLDKNIDLKYKRYISNFYGLETQSLKIPSILKEASAHNPIVNSLVTMNDKGRSFKYIAKWIERYL